MAEKRVRRLSAILAADVVGYSRLMAADEESTLAQLEAHREELVDPAIERHRGRLVKTTGDGMLVEFASVVDAVRCAVAIQRAMPERNAPVATERRIEFRIGINVGDIVVEDGDIFGDGVNIAARLEQFAQPGGVSVSARVQEDTQGKLDVAFEDAGEHQLKNLPRPLRIFNIGFGAASPGTAPAAPSPALPDKPSIAVLPFQNMSGDAEQEYFADGIAEEIITALARMRWLFVIARNSTFVFKGRSVDIKQLGRELGVRYVLEGSVRKAANRIRITGQLIDAAHGAHLWADRFDGALDDVFELQDRITASVVGAIAPKLELAEMERAKRKPTDSLDAYDYYLRGTASAHRFTIEANGEALRLFRKATELDPDFSAAYGGAARCYAQRRANHWGDAASEMAETERLARLAVSTGKDDAVALAWGALGLALVGQLSNADAYLDQALVLNPNLATIWHIGGVIKTWIGEPDAAVEYEARAMRLSPLDPLTGQMQSATAWAHFTAGRTEEAALWAERALREMPSWVPAHIVFVASLAALGRRDAAATAAARLMSLNPEFRVGKLGATYPLRRAEDSARVTQALREAGLPD